MACVSVIVPVFNKAAFLPECLDSILGQSLEDLEVICVDDASTDGSAAILADYAGRDQRIRVIRGLRNRGPGPSRNIGIAVATAPYLQFTDADDVLPTGALEVLYKGALRDRVPIIRGTVQGFSSNGVDHLEDLSAVPDRRAFVPLDEPALWVPWWHPSYLISRKLLLEGKIGYPRLRSGEDPVFLTSVLISAHRMSMVHDVTYRYRMAPMEGKDRATYSSLMDYIHHARLVKQLLSRHRAECWTDGYGPLVSRDIHALIERYPLSSIERTGLRAKAEGLSSEDQPTTHRILFGYRLCGLGGVETSILNKAEALRKRGATAEVLFLDFWGDGGKWIAQRPGVHVLQQKEAQARLFRETWDAIIAVDTPEIIDIALECGVECALLFETHASYRPALTHFYSRVNDAAVEAVIAPTEFNKQLLVAAGCCQDKICVVPNVLDPGAFGFDSAVPAASLAALPNDRPIVLSVGRIEPQKNTLAFIQLALNLLGAGHDLHFVIVGDAVDTQDYAAHVRDAIPESNRPSFTFIQELRYEAMPELYRRTSRSGGCLVVTSVNESQPMTLLEAMACECPVVAPDIGGIGEVVLDSVTGLLYPRDRIEVAVAGVKQLLGSAVLRKRIARQALDLLTLEHSSHRTAELYMSLTKKTRSALREVPAMAEPPAADTAASHASASPTTESRLAARLDRLIGEFVALHNELLHTGSGPSACAKAIGDLFTAPLVAATDDLLKPYAAIAPGVQVGFEPDANVRLRVQPKQDFSRSPDRCLNTLIFRFSGTSRWLTLEAPIEWNEFQNASGFQLGLYGQPDRSLAGRAVLRLPIQNGGSVDHPITVFQLSESVRNCNRSGALALPDLQTLDRNRRARLILFFDSKSELTLQLDYLTIYFA